MIHLLIFDFIILVMFFLASLFNPNVYIINNEMITDEGSTISSVGMQPKPFTKWYMRYVNRYMGAKMKNTLI